MEHVLMAKVFTVGSGDDYQTVTAIEVGDFLIDSNAHVQELAKKVGEAMGYENCRYDGSDYPDSDDFYLTYDVEMSKYPDLTRTITTQETVKVEVMSCLKVHGKLFELKEFHQNKYIDL